MFHISDLYQTAP